MGDEEVRQEILCNEYALLHTAQYNNLNNNVFKLRKYLHISQWTFKW